MNRQHPPSNRGPAVHQPQDPRGRLGAETPGFASGLGALSDILTGGLRGVALATLGLPGDLEKLAHGLYGAATAHEYQSPLRAGLMAADRDTWGPSSDDWRARLPGPTEFSIPAEQNTPMQLAEFGALSPGRAAMVARGLGRMARPAAAGLGRVGAEALRRGVEEARGPLAQVGQAIAPQYAVRPRGGNFSELNLQAYLGGPDVPGGMGAAISDGTSAPTQQWAQKQLANYLKRDMGAPTDPLLAVEKDLPNLHFAAEDPMTLAQAAIDNDASLARRNPLGGVALRQREHERLSNGQPLTPWGHYSDNLMSYGDPESYAAELSGGWVPEGQTAFEAAREAGYNVDWLEKADPLTTKIWGVTDPHEDDLGFKHVLDYLDASQRAHENVSAVGPALRQNAQYMSPEERSMLALYDAGLALSPEQIAKTSVADAVRKTAAWNELLANGMGRFSFASKDQQAQILAQAGIDPAQTKYLDDADMKKIEEAYGALAKGRVPVRYGNDKLLEMVKQAKGAQDYASVQGLYTPSELRAAYEQATARTGGTPKQEDLQFLHNQIRNAVPGEWVTQYFDPAYMPDDFYAPFATKGYASGGSVSQPGLTPFMQKAQAMLSSVSAGQ